LHARSGLALSGARRPVAGQKALAPLLQRAYFTSVLLDPCDFLLGW
jgi:hypothetical protein